MPKPDYKGAEKDILALLETVPEPTTPSSNNRIIDVTEDSLGTVYQFTENELLVIKDTSKGDKDEKIKFPDQMSVEQFHQLLAEIPLNQRREKFIPYEIIKERSVQ